jgi:hypothetical protein
VGLTETFYHTFFKSPLTLYTFVFETGVDSLFSSAGPSSSAAGEGGITTSSATENTKREERTKQKHNKLRTLAGNFQQT